MQKTRYWSLYCCQFKYLLIKVNNSISDKFSTYCMFLVKDGEQYLKPQVETWRIQCDHRCDSRWKMMSPQLVIFSARNWPQTHLLWLLVQLNMKVEPWTDEPWTEFTSDHLCLLHYCISECTYRHHLSLQLWTITTWGFPVWQECILISSRINSSHRLENKGKQWKNNGKWENNGRKNVFLWNFSVNQ